MVRFNLSMYSFCLKERLGLSSFWVNFSNFSIKHLASLITSDFLPFFISCSAFSRNVFVVFKMWTVLVTSWCFEWKWIWASFKFFVVKLQWLQSYLLLLGPHVTENVNGEIFRSLRRVQLCRQSHCKNPFNPALRKGFIKLAKSNCTARHKPKLWRARIPPATTTKLQWNFNLDSSLTGPSLCVLLAQARY